MWLLLADLAENPATPWGIAAAAFALFAVIVRWLLARVDEEARRADAAVKTKDEMAQQLIDKVVPLLTSTTVAVTQTTDLLRDISAAEGRRRRARDDP